MLTVRCDIQAVHFTSKKHSKAPGIFLRSEILDAIHFICLECSDQHWFVGLDDWTAVMSKKFLEIEAKNEVKYFPVPILAGTQWYHF